jgi:UDP-glucose 4-epimerase
MAKKILITGGAGFIGSTVADLFLSRGWDVAVLDDLSSGKLENVATASTFFECDVRSEAAQKAIADFRPDVLCHHAAQIDVRKSMVDPRFDADVNVGGLLNLMTAAVGAGVQQVLFASSGGAGYGETDRIPSPETLLPAPVSTYGASKMASELYLGVFRAAHGIKAACLRYANVYGPRQDPHGEAGVVAIFSGRLLDGKPCTVYGDGKQTRDYVYVTDVARVNLLAAEQGFDGAINVSTGVETDVVELYGHLAKAAGVTAPPEFGAPRAGEQRRSCLNPRLAYARLGWRPEIAVGDGLARTFEWFKKKRG